MAMQPNDSVTPVDQHVGRMLRAIRKSKGVSQEQVADALGLSFQQVQKYENGANRVSASKMFAAAQFLGVKPAAFFEGLEGAGESAFPPEVAAFFAEDGSAQIAAAYPKLKPAQQRAVLAVITGMVD